MCSGASGVAIEPETEDELRFGQALDALLRALAIMMVADGEGAARIARVVVRGRGRRSSQRGRGGGARGRQLAVGQGGASRRGPQLGQDRAGRRRRAPRPGAAGARRSIEGTPVCAGGTAIDYDEATLASAVRAPEVEIEIALPGEGSETEVFFSDLSHEYVTINAEYMT